IAEIMNYNCKEWIELDNPYKSIEIDCENCILYAIHSNNKYRSYKFDNLFLNIKNVNDINLEILTEIFKEIAQMPYVARCELDASLYDNNIQNVQHSDIQKIEKDLI